MVVCKNRAEVLKIKKLKFFQTYPEHRYEWSWLGKNIKSAEKILFCGNSGILCFGGSQPCFPGEIVYLKIMAEKNSFRQQFGNHITILKQEMFFKGSEVFFPRFLKKRFFYEFSNSGKISPIKKELNFGD